MAAAGEPPGLDELLAALRWEGVAVSPTEVVRIRHAFAAGPHLDREGLRGFLACLLVKRPAQRRVFGILFDQWCPEHLAEEPPPRPRRAGRPARPRREPVGALEDDTGFGPTEPQPPPDRARRGWYLAGAVAAALLALTLVLRGIIGGPVVSVERPPVTAPTPIRDESKKEPDLQPAPIVRFWSPAPVDPARDIVIPPRLGPLALLGMGILFALGASLLGYRYRRHGRPRYAPVATVRGGPGWMPLPGVRGSDTWLTRGRERRTLAWSIAHFTAEDHTRRVDQPATATATARAAGVVDLHYRRVRYPRQVWLWRDSRCEVPELAQLVDEISSSLERVGLAVRVGGFPGLPTQVWWGAGDFITPAVEDGHGPQVMVAILTDGAEILRTLRAPSRKSTLVGQLRSLARWPKLAVVDFSGSAAVRRALGRYGIQTIAPRDLPAWLGGQSTEKTGTLAAGAALQGDRLAWAAACALGGKPVAEASAQRLRGHLGLDVDPWQIEALRRHAGPHLDWPPEEGRRLINWLLATGFDGRCLREDSLAGRAVVWWRERYREADRERAHKSNELLPWGHTQARHRWALEAALLDLYLDPATAARDLARLAGEVDPVEGAGLRDEIRRRLASLRTWDMAPGPEHPQIDGQAAGTWAVEAVYLPWRWRDQAEDPALLDTLHRLGLGGRPVAAQVAGFRPPHGHSLALGALAGLALAACTAAAVRHLQPPAIQVRSVDPLLDRPALVAQTPRRIDPIAHSVILGQGKAAEVLARVPPGAEVRVRWCWGGRWSEATGRCEPRTTPNNPQAPYPGSRSRLYLGGTLPEPTRPCGPDWPARSLAVVADSPDDLKGRRLALALLDTGSADLALVGESWLDDLARLPQRSPELDRLTQLSVFLHPGAEVPATLNWPGPWALERADYATVLTVLKAPGARPLSQVPKLAPVKSRGTVLLHGRPGVTRDKTTGITWVHLCSATFTQGTPGESGAKRLGLGDESPARRVSLSAFDITQTEVTNAQYRRFRPDHDPKAAADLPAVNVNWQEARNYCRQLPEGDLPTEAQWEHAARAESDAPWSFGADESRLGQFAWYSGNSEGKLHPVGRKAPNAFGLYDMHGNAWEWVGDWYAQYAPGPQLDPLGPAKGDYRVLRGGSFVLSPEDLRSAFRFFGRPVLRLRFLGFRCVRVPARQD